MTTEQALLKIGTKGADIVLAQMKKIEDAKAKFAKTKPMQLAGRGFDAFQRSLGTRGGVAGMLGRGVSAAVNPREMSEAEKALKLKQQERIENNRLIKATGAAADGLQTIGRGFSSLDPTEFIKSVKGAATQLAAGIVGGGLNAIWGGLGEAAKAAVQYFGQMTDIAVDMSSRSLQAVKSALPVAAQRASEKSFLQATGYERGSMGINQATVSRSEASQLAQALFPMVGKIKAGSQFEQKLTRLFTKNERGEVINRQQATALAQGQFGALGTDKGFFLQQIMGSAGSLPPSVRQKLMGGLLGQVGESDVVRETKQATDLRERAVTFESRDLATQDVIAQNAFKASVYNLNESLNSLSTTMVDKAGVFNEALKEAAKGLNDFVNTFGGPKGSYAKAKEEAIRAR